MIKLHICNKKLHKIAEKHEKSKLNAMTKSRYDDANRLLLPVQRKVLQYAAASRENQQRVEQVGYAEYAAGHEHDSPLEAHGRCLDQEEDVPAQENDATNGEHEND